MALDLAEKARGATSPNPLVGCVIVSPDGHVVGKGYHHKAGEPHAEINAMDDAGEKTAGATAYVTLEPCSHYGRTGPCCEALIKAGIKKVVAAATDPNPRVSGRGFRRLEEAGVEVVSGVLADKAYRQNEIFMHYMKTGRSFVALKYAMTLDGKIATVSGDSKWITGVKARTYAHRLRSRYDAILVGRETVAQDDPSLTVRLVEGKNPLRIILDSKASLPLERKVFTDGAADTLLVVTPQALQEKVRAFADLPGVSVLTAAERDGHVDLSDLLQQLAKKDVTSVLVEGGSDIHGAFFDAGLVERVYAFIAPSLIGGNKSRPAIGGQGASTMEQKVTLQEVTTLPLEPDLLVTGLTRKGV